MTLAWINFSWELDFPVKWIVSVELFPGGKFSQPRICCVYFPAVFNTPFRMMQVFFLLDLPWANVWLSPYFIAFKTPGWLWLLFLHLFVEGIHVQGQRHPLGTTEGCTSTVSSHQWPVILWGSTHPHRAFSCYLWLSKKASLFANFTDVASISLLV